MSHLYKKYQVVKLDGPTDPKATYFPLRVDKDPYARIALRAYSDAIRDADPEFAQELLEWIAEIESLEESDVAQTFTVRHEETRSSPDRLRVRVNIAQGFAGTLFDDATPIEGSWVQTYQTPLGADLLELEREVVLLKECLVFHPRHSVFTELVLRALPRISHLAGRIEGQVRGECEPGG